MHPNCYTTITDFIKDLDTTKDLSVCDVGSFDVNGNFRKSFPENCIYTGVDITAGPNVDIVLSDPCRWKELDGKQFDVIISGNTIEHVKDIYQWFREFAKILKVGGHFYITAPSGKGNEENIVVGIHQYPVDCWRFNHDGLIFLVEEIAGLKMIKWYYSMKDIIAIGTKEA